jgi:glycosyltransferase-like protein
MRIALLTHSTNPRGGVVHVTQLGEALADRGHQVVVHAPDPTGHGFGRTLRCGFAPVPAIAAAAPLQVLVRQRIAEYVEYFQHRRGDAFDIYHAHDGIGGCALATLAERGQINGFVRTVHHLDDFGDAYLHERQDHSITGAAKVLCVSQMWVAELEKRYGINAEQVTNGVDLRRFTPTADQRDDTIHERFGIKKGAPVFLSIGGIEKRKNTTRVLEAFVEIRRQHPKAQLAIAGGASLLDHSTYRESFDAVLQKSGLTIGRDVVLTGTLSDDLMPPLLRSADALVFPSVVEGFGLVVLEAMASGTPVVVSRIEPFTEYLTDPDCAFADPLDVNSIAAAMLRATDPSIAANLRTHGFEVAQRYPWSRSAAMHETIYSNAIQEARNAGNAISRSMA